MNGCTNPDWTGVDRSVYWIASNSKIVTTVAALQLHEAGLWKLDDPVSKFLPEFADVPGVYRSVSAYVAVCARGPHAVVLGRCMPKREEG